MPGPVGNLGTFRFGAPRLPNIPILGGLFGVTWPWSLQNIDTNATPIVGDYFPESMAYNPGAPKYSKANSLNREKPVTQYAHGELDTIAFNALFMARHFLDNLEDRVNALIELTKRDDKLKRPPICLFEVGGIAMQCVVLSVGGIKISEVRNDGTLRSVEFGIVLQEFVPFDILALEQTNPTALEPSTLYKKAKQGDTYETMAKDEYGNALKGVQLRETNPTLGSEIEPGQEVRLLPAENSNIRKAAAPVSVAISKGRDSSNIQTLFNSRANQTRISYVR